MPHVSRNKLEKKTEEQLIHNLTAALSHIEQHTDMLTFLSALLTDTEKLMLAKRLAIIILLEEGLPDAHIATALHVTRITVAKMRYFYEARGEGFVIALQTLKKLEQFATLKKSLIALVNYSARAAGGYVKPTIF